jgi:cation-transporting ATPase E
MSSDPGAGAGRWPLDIGRARQYGIAGKQFRFRALTLGRRRPIANGGCLAVTGPDREAVREDTMGLTGAEVAERVERGETNAVKEATSRSYAHIVRGNVFTRFNAILGSLFVVILIFGSPRDSLFGGVLIVNTFIGIVQEVRAKWTLDRLSLISEAKARVVRDGEEVEVPLGQVVLDDLVELRTGEQVVADGVVIEAQGLEIDESLLTGESVPVIKRPSDEVLSGSFVVAGTGGYRANRVGADAYARKLAREAKQFQLVQSELRNSINTILRYITWLMLPVGILLLSSQLKVYGTFHQAATGTVAGLVGMVPEGLVLLTSVAFAVSVVSLGRKNVLVQELPAVEVLARVDVICLDKTGTLTEGDLAFSRLEPVGGTDIGDDEARRVLGGFGSDKASKSSTLEAIAESFPPAEELKIEGRVPFSSTRKWSAESFAGMGTWVMGAPEMLIDRTPAPEKLQEQVDGIASQGLRVLLLVKAGAAIREERLPETLEPAVLLVFQERLRPDAKQTLEYFKEQGVAVKVISGDSPVTVAAVARGVGVPDVGEPVDARSLPEDIEELAVILERKTVFGRVGPDQKQHMVEALQSKGHVVAMTGDGVNDVLALKTADIGIAMGSGSPASRAVAQLVLLDGRFATMPDIVAEGRRVIGNMERVANLFITKTVYATLLSIAIGLAGWAFIFLPRHLTLVSGLTIGIPAFILSFAPNKARYRPGFVKRVLRFTLPAGIVAALAAFTAAALSHIYPWINLNESRTTATLVLVILGLWVLAVLSRPWTWWKEGLVATMVAGLVIVVTVPWLRDFFALDIPQLTIILQTAAISGAGIVLMEFGWRLSGWNKREHREHLRQAA